MGRGGGGGGSWRQKDSGTKVGGGWGWGAPPSEAVSRLSRRRVSVDWESCLPSEKRKGDRVN